MRTFPWVLLSILTLMLATACGDDGGAPSPMGDASPPDAMGAADAEADGSVMMDAATEDAAPPDASVPDATATEALPPGVTNLSFEQEIDGVMVSRSVVLHVPMTVDAASSYPIVFAFHGAGGTNERWSRAFREYVDAGRFVGVYPQGHNRRWNINPEDDETTADDVAFVRMITDYLMRYRNLNHERRFAYGTSNGGGISLKLAVQTTLFKAITSVVTQLSRGNEPTASTGTVGVMQILGVIDRLIPYEGGSGPMGLTFHSGVESARLWAMHNGCMTTYDLPTMAGNRRIEHTDCTDGVRVIHYGIEGAGHGIPGDTEGGLVGLAEEFFDMTP